MDYLKIISNHVNDFTPLRLEEISDIDLYYNPSKNKLFDKQGFEMYVSDQLLAKEIYKSFCKRQDEDEQAMKMAELERKANAINTVGWYCNTIQPILIAHFAQNPPKFKDDGYLYKRDEIKFYEVINKYKPPVNSFRAIYRANSIHHAILLQVHQSISNLVLSLPNDEKVKAHIDTFTHYGYCINEYNEGFEDGVKWLKEQLAK